MSRIDLITLGKIRDAKPCAEGWEKLITGLGYTDGKPDLDRVVSIGDIAHINDAADALWATRCLPETIEARRFRVSLLLPAIRRALAHTKDERVHTKLERWVGGDDSVDLEAAAEAAWAAAEAAEAAAEAAEAAEAAKVAWAAAEEAWAAWAAWAAAWAAAEAAEAAKVAWAAKAAEYERQRADIIALSPLFATQEQQ